jgi:hypothetical protein
MEDKQTNWQLIFNRNRLYLQLLELNITHPLEADHKKLDHNEIMKIVNEKYPLPKHYPKPL